MARWGEGDPRWIVEERLDAKNVNNWHWTEKNANQWSIDTIKELFSDLKIIGDEFSCDFKDVTKCEGEANVSNRKGKLIFLYEWRIEADWVGFASGDNKTQFKGKIEVLNLSDENSVDDLDILVSCNSDNGDGIKRYMQTTGVEKIKMTLSKYITKLKDEYSRGLILPTKTTTVNQVSQTTNTVVKSKTVLNYSSPKCKPMSKDTTCQDYSLTEEFYCCPDDLYKVLTIKEMVQGFTRSDATIVQSIGGEFSLFGGRISGVFRELVPASSIIMDWRKQDWPENHYSQVILKLEQCDGGTVLTMNHMNVPAYDLENTKSGWQSNIFTAIKKTYGYGGYLF